MNFVFTRKSIFRFSIFMFIVVGAIPNAFAQETIEAMNKKLQTQLSDTARANALVELGLLYEKANMPDSAVFYYQKSRNFVDVSISSAKVSREVSEELQLISNKALRYLGSFHRSRGDFAKARETFLQGIENAESLIENIRKSRKDFAKGELSKIHNNLGTLEIISGNFAPAIEWHKKSYDLKVEIKDDKGAANSLVNIGNAYFFQGDYEKSIQNYQSALEILQGGNENKELSTIYNAIGNVYFQQGNYEKALEYYLESLKIEEEQDNKNGLSRSFISLGNVHFHVGNLNQSLYYYRQAYELKKEIGDRKGEAGCLNNLGNIYRHQRDFHKAADAYLEALNIYQGLNDVRGLMETYTSLGVAFIDQGLFAEAEEYLNQALILAEKTKSKSLIANIYANLANLYNGQKKYDLAVMASMKGLEISHELGVIKEVRNAYSQLTLAWEKKGDFKKALEYYKSYKQYSDSLMNSEKHEQITRMEAIYQSEKKQSQIELFIKDKELQDAIIARQNIIMTIIGVSLLIVIVLIVILYRIYQRKREFANELIEKNRLITDQKIQITNGIRYASRIQNAILPSLDVVKEILPEHFILFLPKDIVSGDFYWIAQRNNKVILAVADCTGHGVSGAFMSMLGISFLIQIVTIEKTIESDKILNKLKGYFNSALYPEGIKTEQKDGMEIAIAIIDPEEMTAEYSGANSPLVLIRDGEIKEFEPNKTAIGTSRSDNGFFKRHLIDLKKNDSIYLFSDGFISQFGGGNGQMFMSKPFRQLLVNIQDKPAEEQKQILYKTHLEWKGSNDQIDDILVLGIKI